MLAFWHLKIPVPILLLIIYVDISVQIWPVEVKSCTAFTLLLEDVEQLEVCVAVFDDSEGVNVLQVDNSIVRVILHEQHLLEVEQHVHGHGKSDDEREEPSDHCLLRVSLLVKVELYDVAEHVPFGQGL